MRDNTEAGFLHIKHAIDRVTQRVSALENVPEMDVAEDHEQHSAKMFNERDEILFHFAILMYAVLSFRVIL